MLATSAPAASRGADAYTNTWALTNGVLGLQVCHRDSQLVTKSTNDVLGLQVCHRRAEHARCLSWQRPKTSNGQYISQVFDEIYVRDSIS
jgi:hypothetical protein